MEFKFFGELNGEECDRINVKISWQIEFGVIL